MKKLCILGPLLLIAIFAASRTVQLSGKVRGLKSRSMTLVLLLGDGHYSTPSFTILVGESMSFRQTIDIPFTTFALLKYDDTETRILLTPGRALAIDIDLKDGERQKVVFAGPAAPENKFIQDEELGQIPFFMKDDWQQNEYAGLSADSVKLLVFDSLDKHVQALDQKINRLTASLAIKNILKSEFRYAGQCYLNDLAMNYMRWKKNPAAPTIADWMIAWQPVPDSGTLVSGFYANMMMRYRISYALNKATRPAGKDKAAREKAFEQLFRTSFDNVTKLVDKYGERYILAWLFSKSNFNKDVQDKILVDKVLDAANDGQHATASMLLDTLKHYFPKSNYLPIAQREVTRMEIAMAKNGANNAIVIHASVKPSAFKELTDQYKGKLIYVDIWGTWCGPCRIEMRYVAELKKRYQGKDIVFVYLDMDEDAKEEDWKRYIRYYGIEGEHYRLNKTQIEPFWHEIKANGGETHLYPTYVLFDKGGKMLRANAERPSSKEVLFRQLDEVL